jgi:hypothetical protein
LLAVVSEILKGSFRLVVVELVVSRPVGVDARNHGEFRSELVAHSSVGFTGLEVLRAAGKKLDELFRTDRFEAGVVGCVFSNRHGRQQYRQGDSE